MLRVRRHSRINFVFRTFYNPTRQQEIMKRKLFILNSETYHPPKNYLPKLNQRYINVLTTTMVQSSIPILSREISNSFHKPFQIQNLTCSILHLAFLRFFQLTRAYCKEPNPIYNSFHPHPKGTRLNKTKWKPRTHCFCHKNKIFTSNGCSNNLELVQMCF